MKLYGLAELAETTGLPIETLRTWRNRGKLPAPTFMLKAGQFWQGSEIEEWIVQRRPAANGAKL